LKGEEKSKFEGEAEMVYEAADCGRRAPHGCKVMIKKRLNRKARKEDLEEKKQARLDEKRELRRKGRYETERKKTAEIKG
jgi:hypothetical protein